MQDRQDEVICHDELLDALMESSLAPTEAEALLQKMDEMSLVLLVRGKTIRIPLFLDEGGTRADQLAGKRRPDEASDA